MCYDEIKDHDEWLERETLAGLNQISNSKG